MSIRKEVLQGIGQEIKEKGFLLLDRKKRASAKRDYTASRELYQGARKDFLYYELPLFYRVAYFGSARLNQNDPECQRVSEIAKGFTAATRTGDTVTGGGPGIMMAANQGAHLAIIEAGNNGKKIKAKNYGLPIEGLPNPEKGAFNHFDVMHPEFLTRIQEFVDLTRAAYYAPGGYGTLLELALVLQVKQVSHLENEYPIIVSRFWEPLINLCNNMMYYDRERDDLTTLISDEDLNLVTFENSVPETIDLLVENYNKWRRNYRSHVRQLAPVRVDQSSSLIEVAPP